MVEKKHAYNSKVKQVPTKAYMYKGRPFFYLFIRNHRKVFFHNCFSRYDIPNDKLVLYRFGDGMFGDTDRSLEISNMIKIDNQSF